MFQAAYKGQRVLVTGHTGFKGSWLTTWLLKLGAEVTGLSKDIPTSPSMFNSLGLVSRIRHIEGDVCDLAKLREVVQAVKPSFVFHLAAQAIVSTSYEDPVETFSTNTMGTLNVLEALRGTQHPCVAVMITSDKCYDNVEWVWGYRETDALGGKDTYSGSKGAAELVIKSYAASFFSSNHPVRVVVGRAGNVIGGGDWARDRLVADCMRAWSEGRAVEIRSPSSTRPWQHVLEPLSGYLALGARTCKNSSFHGHAFNFGPRSEENHTVVELLTDLAHHWGHVSIDQAYKITGQLPFREASLLKLNCDKALLKLNWSPTLHYEETTRLVASWYAAYYQQQTDMNALTIEQIDFYERNALARSRE